MESKLPKWFDGTKHKQGDIVANPFSGEEFYLDKDELSMYDFLKGAEYTLMMIQQQILDGKIEEAPKSAQKLADDFDKARYWFSKNNIDAYMALID